MLVSSSDIHSPSGLHGERVAGDSCHRDQGKEWHDDLLTEMPVTRPGAAGCHGAQGGGRGRQGLPVGVGSPGEGLSRLPQLFFCHRVTSPWLGEFFPCSGERKASKYELSLQVIVFSFMHLKHYEK